MRVIMKTGFMALTILFLLLSCTSPLVDQVRTAVTVARGPRLTLTAGTTAIPSGGTADFGQVMVGSSKSATLTIGNSGRAELALTGGAASVSLSGANMNQFAVSAAPSAAVVAVGQNTSFTLTFIPTSAGPKTATIAVASNDPSTSSFTFTMTGTGINSGQVDTPTFSPDPGRSYGNDISVTITCATPGATIYYTTNGLMPTTSSTVYGNPIAVKDDKARVQIMAIAVRAGMDTSEPQSGWYYIDYTYPETPKDLTATPGCKQVTLTWSSAARANSYNVYYAPGSIVTTSGTQIQVPSGRTCTVTGLADGTEYAFIVTGANNSVNPIVEGGPSYPLVTATTVGVPPAPTSSTGATWINAAQKGAGITITVGGLDATGAVPGDTLTLFLNGTSIAMRTLQAGDITALGCGFTVSGGTLGTDGAKSFTAQITDQTSHVGAMSPALSLTLDSQPPTINNASFSPSTGLLKAGSSVTLNITTGSSETGLTASFITVNGANVTGTFGGSGPNWHATYVVSGGDTNRGQNAIPISISLADAAGNACAPYTTPPSSTPGVDTIAPFGYSASINQTYVNISAVSSVSMSFAGADMGDSYSCNISSSGGGGPVTGTGTVTSPNQSFVLNLSSLGDGTLTVSLSLTDPAGNAGTLATTTKTKDTMTPSGYSASIDYVYVNYSNSHWVNMSFSGAEVGASYNYSISSSGGGTTVTGAGTVSSPTQAISGLDLSSLGDGTLTVSLTLTDPAGNAGTPAITTKTKDTVQPGGYSASITQPYVNSSNVSSVNMSFSGAEVGASYNYSISSSGGGTTVTGAGTVSSPTQAISGLDLSGLGDGTLTVSLSLTDPAGNAGTPAITTKTKDTTVPTAVHVQIMGGTNIEVDFSEGVYGNYQATTPLGVNSVTFIDQYNSNCHASVNFVDHNPGSSIARYSVNWSTTPTGGDTILVLANPSQIFDAAGNEVPAGPLGQGTW